ncbi:hypothetical protein PIB30_095756, partial [Stylosanthes scabra]|nr:hypothetical protein [Stylosanthes scabra]
LDKTEKKAELGANAILPVSIAACKAGAAEKEVPLYRHIADLYGKASPMLPILAFTVISGGKHAGNNLAIQEAVRRAGYTDKIKIAFDVAATNFCIGTRYDLDFKSPQKSGHNFLSAENMVELYRELCNDFPIMSIEDPFGMEDWEHIKRFSSTGICQVVGDDF